MLLQDAEAFVATTALDRRLKLLEQHCTIASAATSPVTGIQQALQELRLQVHCSNKASASMHPRKQLEAGMACGPMCDLALRCTGQ